jgi:hypothetical protein
MGVVDRSVETSVVHGVRQSIHEGTLVFRQALGEQPAGWWLEGCRRLTPSGDEESYEVWLGALMQSMAGEEVRFILISLSDVAVIQRLVEQEQAALDNNTTT